MKTLKEELQEIVVNNNLGVDFNYICSRLSDENIQLFEKHKNMASNYATKHFHGSFSWWNMQLSERDKLYVISEKYRFIKDLIAIL